MKRFQILIVRAIGIGLVMGTALWGCSESSGSGGSGGTGGVGGGGNGGDGGYFDQCDTGVPADECYRTRRDPESAQVEAAEDVAREWLANHPAEDATWEQELPWDWRAGVLMFAFTELHRVTADEALRAELRAYYKAWLDYHIAAGYTIVWSDSCPPAITAITLLDETPPDDYQQVVDDVLEYLDDIAPRTAEGGISHNGILGQLSVWLDSLFMFGMVLNRYGELAEPERLEMMSEQIQIFADILQDDNGFMRHAQDWPGYDETIYWARGNSWVVASLADYLRIAVESGEPDPAVQAIFEKHVAAILSAQDETGMWQTVMSHPEEPGNYLETSGTALFAYGIARAWRYGLLSDEDRRAAQKAAAYIQQNRIVDDIVTGVSGATDPWPLRDPDGFGAGYLDVPLEDDKDYGVGAMILALIETSGLPE